MRRVASLVIGIAAGLGCFAAAGTAAADQSVIKFPGMHPRYVFEAEPHVLIAPFHDFLPGIGFRGTIELIDNGFIPSINNTVGIGFGADFAFKGVWIPVVMQWNFWLTRNWSVFGEPGVAIRAGERLGRHDDGAGWVGLWAGGRYHFNDNVALTMRVGRPTVSIGVSFLM